MRRRSEFGDKLKKVRLDATASEQWQDEGVAIRLQQRLLSLHRQVATGKRHVMVQLKRLERRRLHLVMKETVK